MIRINSLVAVAIAACVGAGQALALEEKRYGDTPYITGGVGEDEQQELKDRQAQYTLGVMIARKGSGEYLSDCRVTISRAGTTLLEATMDGPFLFARLPAGTYRVRAAFDGQVQERQVTIGSRGGMTRTNFYWD